MTLINIDPTLLQPVDAPAAEKRRQVLDLIGKSYYADNCVDRLMPLIEMAELFGIGIPEACDHLRNWKKDGAA